MLSFVFSFWKLCISCCSLADYCFLFWWKFVVKAQLDALNRCCHSIVWLLRLVWPLISPSRLALGASLLRVIFRIFAFFFIIIVVVYVLCLFDSVCSLNLSGFDEHCDILVYCFGQLCDILFGLVGENAMRKERNEKL